MKTYHDITGDGGSNVLEQVAEQQALTERALSGVRWMLAIGSGKGGVGKSTMTLHLAALLQARGHRIAVLDADLNGPTQARLAGMGAVPFVPSDSGLALPRSPGGLGVVSLGAAVPETEAVQFDSVAKGDSHTWRATREFTLLGELLRTVEWGELDCLLIDLPPGAERTFQFAEFLGRRTAFVLVTIPSELSRGIVGRSAAALADTPNPVLGYIENMSGYYCADCGDLKPLFPASGEVGWDLPCLGRVPFDPGLAALCDRGESLERLPDSAAVRALGPIADELLGRLRALEEKP